LIQVPLAQVNTSIADKEVTFKEFESERLKEVLEHKISALLVQDLTIFSLTSIETVLQSVVTNTTAPRRMCRVLALIIPMQTLYMIDLLLLSKEKSTFRIGRGKRTDEYMGDAPGPGHYTYVDAIRGPKFAFNRELRGEKNRNLNPGPAGALCVIGRLLNSSKYPKRAKLHNVIGAISFWRALLTLFVPAGIIIKYGVAS
jgi:hypothetical protein